MITRSALLEFMRANRYVVESSVHAGGGPQSAVVGVAVSDDFEVVFDTMESSRKAQNLRLKPEIAIVFRGVLPDDERTAVLAHLETCDKHPEMQELMAVAASLALAAPEMVPPFVS